MLLTQAEYAGMPVQPVGRAGPSYPWREMEMPEALGRAEMGAIRARLMDAPARAKFLAKAEYVRTMFPESVADLVRRADEAASGMLVLPGTGNRPYPVGTPVDWHANPVRDNEFVWILNRMEHWLTLVRAYAVTGREGYARTVVEQVWDWVAVCPPLHCGVEAGGGVKVDPVLWGVHPWRMLEVGIRLYRTWPEVMYALAASEALDDETLRLMQASMAEQAWHLYRASPKLWPDADHNHYLMEMVGLLSAATMLTWHPQAQTWRHFALGELERCAAAQLTECGGQIEGCPHYHNGCVDWFHRPIALVRDMDEAGLALGAEYLRRVHGMLDYALHATRPNGTGVPWGDSDADKLVVATSLYAWEFFDDARGLEVLRRLMPAGELREAMAGQAWTFSRLGEAMRHVEGPAGAVSLPRVARMAGLEQVAMRSGWERESASVFFACRTPVENEHAHIDPAGFDFTALGVPIVVDPGRYCYRQDEDRRWFKSAFSHNTLTVNGSEPFEYRGSWEYGPQREGRITAAGEVETAAGRVQYAACRHVNYEPVRHDRAVFLLGESAGAVLMVLDRLTGLQERDRVQVHFHFDTEEVVAMRGEERGASRVEAMFRAGRCVMRSGDVLGEGNNAEVTLRDGRVSDFLDVSRASKIVTLEHSGFDPQAQGKLMVLTTLAVGRAGVGGEDVIGEVGGSWLRPVVRLRVRVVSLGLGLDWSEGGELGVCVQKPHV